MWKGSGSRCACRLGHIWLFVTPWTVAHQALLFMEFSRQECWSGLPFPTPGDLADTGIEPTFPASAGGFFTTSITWEAPTLGSHLSAFCLYKFPYSGQLIYRKSYKWSFATGFLTYHVFKVHLHYGTYQYLTPFHGWMIFHCVEGPHFVSSFISWWMFGLLPPWGYYE